MAIGRILLSTGLLLAGATGVAAQCRVASAGPCTIDLHGDGAPKAAAVCVQEAWKGHLSFELTDRFADGNQDGWHETVVEIDIGPERGCGCAVFRIEFEGEPAGQSVNIGDSPTNDGYGGDAWSTRFDAELMVNGTALTAFGSERPDSPAESQIFGLREMPLADRVLELEVCDQSVRFAIDAGRDAKPLRGFFNTYRSRDLLAIRPAPEAKSADGNEPDGRIYAAFNRVIHRRAGRPSQNRFGSGVRSVQVSLTP